MIVTAYKGGRSTSSAGGYGLKIRIEDRNLYFDRRWKKVFLQLDPGMKFIEINVDKPSFWNDSCHELISKQIGIWLINRGLAPWTKGIPPKLTMRHIKENLFALEV